MTSPYASYAVVSRFNDAQIPDSQIRVVDYVTAHYPGLHHVSLHEADIVFLFGGDGTILEAIRSAYPLKADILAFHTGNVGFLSTVREAERFIEIVEKAIRGELERLPVPVLRVTLHRKNIESIEVRAINDVVIECLMTWLNLRVDCVGGDGERFIKQARGSGICICSPIGSTSPMAVHHHAPVIDASLSAFYLKALHDMCSPRSGLLVSAEDKMLRLTLMSVDRNPGIPTEKQQTPSVFVDGIYAGDLSASDVVEIQYLPERATLLRVPEDDVWHRLM